MEYILLLVFMKQPLFSAVLPWPGAVRRNVSKITGEILLPEGTPAPKRCPDS
ncbi:hypothetical protein [Allofournierella massiliensis]|uniref:hypothetical protein n=1 Tax=Allofournierella massiliensis TaxID=1650663 RepID=UPI00320892EF